MRKSIIVTGAVALFSLIASARSYEIVLTRPVVAANVQICPGLYRMKVRGTTARFADENSLRVYKAAVTIERAPTKFQVTAVYYTNGKNLDRIKAIELRGSLNKIHFHQ